MDQHPWDSILAMEELIAEQQQQQQQATMRPQEENTSHRDAANSKPIEQQQQQQEQQQEEGVVTHDSNRDEEDHFGPKQVQAQQQQGEPETRSAETTCTITVDDSPAAAAHTTNPAPVNTASFAATGNEYACCFGPNDVVLGKKRKTHNTKATQEFETELVRCVLESRGRAYNGGGGQQQVQRQKELLIIRRFVKLWASRFHNDRTIWFDRDGTRATRVAFDWEHNPLDEYFVNFLEQLVEVAIRRQRRDSNNVDSAAAAGGPYASNTVIVTQQQPSPFVYPTQFSDKTTERVAAGVKIAATTRDRQLLAITQHQHHVSTTKRIERYDCILGLSVSACPGNVYFQELLQRLYEKSGRQPANVYEALRMAGAVCAIISQKGGRFLRAISESRGCCVYQILDRPSTLLYFRKQCEKAFANRDNKRSTAPQTVIDLTEGDDDESPNNPVPTTTATATPTTATTAAAVSQHPHSARTIQQPVFRQILSKCTPRDVLLGSNDFSPWPGNRYCLELMRYYFCNTRGYKNAEWKRFIVDRIVHDVMASGGRFLFLGPHQYHQHSRTDEQNWVQLNSQTASQNLHKMLDEYHASKAAAEQTDRGQQHCPGSVPAPAQQHPEAKTQHSQGAKRPKDGKGGAETPPAKKAKLTQPTAAALAFQGTIYGNKHKVVWAGPPDDTIKGIDWTGWQKEKEERSTGDHVDPYW